MIIFTTLIRNSKEGQVIGSLIHLAILIPFLFLRSKLSAFFLKPRNLHNIILEGEKSSPWNKTTLYHT